MNPQHVHTSSLGLDKKVANNTDQKKTNCHCFDRGIHSGVARAQPMPGHSMGTLCLRVASYPGPAQLLRLQYENTEATREVWGVLPQKILGIFELPRSILRLL